MALSANETKKRKCDGGQFARGLHKRKNLEAGSASASAEKTATLGKGATTSPTGKTVRKTGAGKATTGKTVRKTGAGKATADKTVRKTGAGKATTGKTVNKTGAGKATTGKIVSKTGAGMAMNQDGSGEIQEMEMVQSLVEQEAATIVSEHPLSIEEVVQAYDALVKMHARWREGKRQLGRRKQGDFKLSASQLKLEHKHEIDAFLQTIRDMEGENLRLKAGRPQTPDNSVQASVKEAGKPNSTINEEVESRKKQINELQTHAKKVEVEKFQLRGQLDQQSAAVISLDSRLVEVRADNAKLKQKVETLETTHATQETLDKRTVELNKQARVQELERATLAQEKKQHAETVEKYKVAHHAWMRDRDATLSELHGLQQENAKIGDYSKAVNEWISKCRNAEREKKDAQNDYNELQCIRANLEKELKDSRHAVQDLEKELNDSRRAVQDLERENADLRLWMRSLDACCDVEIATNKFVSARTAAFQSKWGRERRDFCVAKYEELYPGQGGDLDRQMRAFTSTQNRICHDRDIRHVSHEEFLRTGDDIRDRLADLAVSTAPATL
ncbi:hypothetical protein PF002_g17385 [Phytophthora fragariae]|uniref:Uncharacterized protein n=1 Tax=Phytophthora fragariae TaxID=53985 RepID=A0A6A3EAX5_9STRA|nr:hypothetical protein PF009_g21588 [Phytophthora fragariae]KAE9215389.1 hypothetical protein PF002_g17385 [Phytophthora fragariae]KAE9291427.1 hypothetical protein PF001_g19165 [Phytophthora fragariae]